MSETGETPQPPITSADVAGNESQGADTFRLTQAEKEAIAQGTPSGPAHGQEEGPSAFRLTKPEKEAIAGVTGHESQGASAFRLSQAEKEAIAHGTPSESVGPQETDQAMRDVRQELGELDTAQDSPPGEQPAQ